MHHILVGQANSLLQTGGTTATLANTLCGYGALSAQTQCIVRLINV